MIKFSHYVTVYDKEDRHIPILPVVLSDRQLLELKDFCKKYDYRIHVEEAIDVCALPFD